MRGVLGTGDVATSGASRLVEAAEARPWRVRGSRTSRRRASVGSGCLVAVVAGSRRGSGHFLLAGEIRRTPWTQNKRLVLFNLSHGRRELQFMRNTGQIGTHIR